MLELVYWTPCLFLKRETLKCPGQKAESEEESVTEHRGYHQGGLDEECDAMPCPVTRGQASGALFFPAYLPHSGFVRLMLSVCKAQ